LKNKHLCLIIFFLTLILVFSGCENNDETGTADIDWVERVVMAGNNPRSADDAGADYIEPRNYDTLSLDLATFADRWNEAGRNLEVSGLRIYEWEVKYSKPFLSFEAEKDYWAVFGTTNYNDNKLRYAGIEWDIQEGISGETIANVWAALIYAANYDYTTEDVMNIINELGIYDLSPDQIIDYEIIEAIDGIEYDFYSAESWGEFIVGVD